MNQITRDEYNKIEAYNYSTLKKLDKHPSLLLEEHKELTETDAPFNMGHLFELLIEDEIDTINKNYYIVKKQINEPNDNYIKIVNELIQEYQTLDMFYPTLEDVAKEAICSKAKILGVGGSTWKDDRIVEDVIKKASDYYKFKWDSNGRIVIFQSDYDKVVEGVNLTKNGQFTSKVFEIINPNVIVENQVLVQGNIQGFDYKGIIDKRIIDRHNKRIYIYDYKTTNSYYKNFENNIWKFRYDIQAALYTKLTRLEFPDPDYEITYHLIVYSFVEAKDAVLFTFGNGLLDEHFTKLEITRNNKTYKTINALSNELSYHQKVNNFDYSYEILTGKGQVFIV